MLSPLELHEKLRTESLTSAEQDWLHEQVRKYPYFPLFRVLLAKQAIKDDSQAISNHPAVKLAFLYTPDPACLNRILSGEPISAISPLKEDATSQFEHATESAEVQRTSIEDEAVLPLSAYPEYEPVANLNDPIYPVVSEGMDPTFERSFQARFDIVNDIFTQIRSHLKKQDDPRQMQSARVFEDLAAFDTALPSNNTFSRFVQPHFDNEPRQFHQNDKNPKIETADNQARLEKAREELIHKTKKLEGLSSKLQVTVEPEIDSSSIVIIHKNEVTVSKSKEEIAENKPLLEQEKRIISESMKRFINPDFGDRKATPENNFLKDSETPARVDKKPSLITSVKYSTNKDDSKTEVPDEKEISSVVDTSVLAVNTLTNQEEKLPEESELADTVTLFQEVPENQVATQEIVIEIDRPTTERIRTDSMKRFVDPEFEVRSTNREQPETALPASKTTPPKTQEILPEKIINEHIPATKPEKLANAEQLNLPSPEQQRVSTDSMKRFVEPVFDTKNKNKAPELQTPPHTDTPKKFEEATAQPVNIEPDVTASITKSKTPQTLKESPSFDRFAPPEFEERRINRPDYDNFPPTQETVAEQDTFEVVRNNLKIRIRVSNEQLAKLFAKVQQIEVIEKQSVAPIEETKSIPQTIEDRLAFAFGLGAEMHQTSIELASQDTEEKQRLLRAEQERIQRELEAETARQAEQEKQRAEQERIQRELEAEIARQAEQEKQRAEQERIQRELEAETARQAEQEKQRLLQAEQERIQRELEAETARQAEQEKQRLLQAEQERIQRELEAETARQAEQEKQRLLQAEQERIQHDLEAETARQAEQEKQRLLQLKAEAIRQAEQEKQRILQTKQEYVQRELEAEVARQAEQEKQRLLQAEQERIQRELEAEVARQTEQEKLLSLQVESELANPEELTKIETTLKAEVTARIQLEQQIEQSSKEAEQTKSPPTLDDAELHPELNRKQLVEQQNLLKSQLEKIKSKAFVPSKDVDIQGIQNKFLKSILKNPTSQRPKTPVNIPVPPAAEEKIVKKRPNSDIDGIIDKFIQLEPSLSNLGKQSIQQHVEFSIPEEESVVEFSLDLISETLAKIHEQQGNIEQAIMMYEKLAQKFPEKTTIFMAQADRLRGSS